ncbi:DNA polymerase III subunit delta [Aggregatilinea lenta]|uniref:DNA polymerase III subunit delta n=1 Tax=Aggregatilinea lenta TaxID=913108 RepID=UPI000E5B3161|nr:DNA polymerase III subunit delta [Aggregatilinea lenta]
MAKRSPTFYVFHGTDEFSCCAAVHSLREQMGDPSMAELNTAVIDGKQATAAGVLAAASAMPFLSDKRLVIVEGMLTWLARKGGGKTAKTEVTALVEGLPDLPDFARVVFVEPGTLSAQNAVLKLAMTAPGGFHKAFNPPRDPSRWIVQQSQTEYDTGIEPAAALALAQVVGDDLRAADSELAKLAAYVDHQRAITQADVALLTPYVAEADVFEMVDALGRRDGAAAVQLLHRLLEDDDPLRLFGMIVRQFRLLLQAREFLNDGGAPNQIGSAIGVHPYVGEKLAAQVRSFTLAQLERIYHVLLETDLGIKTGKVEGVLALDLLIAGVSQ